MTLAYPICGTPAASAGLFPAYKSTVSGRRQKKPLIIMRQTLSELTRPVYGHETVRENDADPHTQHAGEPLGERIIVQAMCWTRGRRRAQYAARDLQANACPAATSTWSISIRHRLDPNFTGRGPRSPTRRLLQIRDSKPGRLSLGATSQRLAPRHFHFRFVSFFVSRLVTQMVFPRSAVSVRSDLSIR